MSTTRRFGAASPVLRLFLVFFLVPLFVVSGLVAAARSAGAPADEFYTAIRANDLGAIQSLTERGVAGVKDRRAITPLMYAAAVGSVEAMRVLLDAGADVNARNDVNSTALMWSATELPKVRLLLDRGADLNAVSDKGRSALMVAAMTDGSAEIVRLLIARGADVKIADRFKSTALHAAVIGNDMATIRQIVDAGVDINAADGAEYTPLMGAAQRGNLEAVRLLLAKGARVNAVSGVGDIATHTNSQVKNGQLGFGHFTALLLASPWGPPEVLATLLDAGADVNAKDIRGLTPLMLAVACDHANADSVRLLLARGADVGARSLLGETVMDWALKFGRTPIAAALERAGAVATDRPPVQSGDASPIELRPALARSVGLLERTSADYGNRGGCVACHAQNMMDVVAHSVRGAGLPIDEALAATRQKLTKARYVFESSTLLERIDVPGTPDVPLYSLDALASAGAAPDWATDAMIANVAAQQQRDGRWHAGGIARPPIQDGDIFRTALGIRALKTYAAPGRADMPARLAKALEWLRAAAPTTAEDRNLQLLGLVWGGADSRELSDLAAAIAAKQNADGGWSQRDELASDAYATGQSLFALAAVHRIDAAFRRGVQFLLSTQRADGSWYVASRSPKFQPFFESGFPYGHDQWISSAATGWAAAALGRAVASASATANGAPR